MAQRWGSRAGGFFRSTRAGSDALYRRRRAGSGSVVQASRCGLGWAKPRGIRSPKPLDRTRAEDRVERWQWTSSHLAMVPIPFMDDRNSDGFAPGMAVFRRDSAARGRHVFCDCSEHAISRVLSPSTLRTFVGYGARRRMGGIECGLQGGWHRGSRSTRSKDSPWRSSQSGQRSRTADGQSYGLHRRDLKAGLDLAAARRGFVVKRVHGIAHVRSSGFIAGPSSRHQASTLCAQTSRPCEGEGWLGVCACSGVSSWATFQYGTVNP